MSPYPDPAISPGEVAEGIKPRLLAAEARDIVRKNRDVLARPILDKVEAAILSSINQDRLNATVDWQKANQTTVNQVIQDLQERGYKVSASYPSLSLVRFTISFYS